MADSNPILADSDRLAAIDASDLLDSGTIPALDRIVEFAARLLDAPVAQVNVITADQQIPVSHVGGDSWGEPVDLSRSLCQHATIRGKPLVIDDLREQPSFCLSPVVTEAGIASYLSVPIFSPRSTSSIATLCVVDFRVRSWSEREIKTLGDLGAWVLSEIELRAGAFRDRSRAEQALRLSEAHIRAIYDGTYEYIGLLSPDGRVLDCNRASLEFVGKERADVVGQLFWETPWFRYTAGAPELLRDRVARAAKGEFVRYEAALERPTGPSVVFDFSLYPIRDETGNVAYIVSEGRDVTEHQQAEAARRQSEDQYRTLFESLDEGFCVLEMLFDADDRPIDYRFIEANPAFEEQSGLRNVVGRTVSDLVPGLESSWFERYGSVARSGRPVRFQDSSDEMGRSFDVYAFRLGPAENRQVAVLFRDITALRSADTERERLLAELRAERERLAEVIRRAPAFMTVLRGREFVLDLVNDEYLELIGHRDVLGKPLFDAVPEVRGQGLEEPLRRAFDTGEPFIGRERPILLQRVPGAPMEERILDVAYVPLLEADGTRSAIVVHGTDVTDRVRGQAEMERAKDRAERLQALTAALARTRTLDDVASVVVADMVVALGARTGSLAGYEAEGGTMILLRTIGFPDDVLRGIGRQPLALESPLTECFRTREPVWIESRGGPDGLDGRFPPIRPVWDVLGVGSAAFVPLVAGGETIGVISFAFVGPRKFEAEERTFLLTLGQQAALAVERARLFDAERAARAEAERANRAKSEFLAVMSHELRTPLNAIGGYAEILEMGIHGPVTPKQAEDLRRLQTSQRHLLGLINEVLNYAKLETGTVRFDVGPVMVHDALASAEALVAPQARKKGIEVEVLDGPPGLTALADGEKVRQILVNLLSNAAKFTDPGGRIELFGERREDMVTISVRDTGIGIAPDQLDRIFEPFIQVRSDLTRIAEGTGLGLAISRDLARAMSGDLTVTSTPDSGSTFTLSLPAT